MLFSSVCNLDFSKYRMCAAQPRDLSDVLMEDEIEELQPPKKKRKLNDGNEDKRGRHWFLTWNNPPENGTEILAEIAQACKCYVYQMECVTVPHWQGCFSFKHQKYWSELDNKLEPKGHWNRCRNVMAARQYCSKIDSRIGETYSKGFKLKHRKVRDPLAGKELYAYQKEIIEIVQQEPDDRTVYWYWSSKGNIGKSALCKHLCMKYDGIILGGREADAKYAIAKVLEKGKEPDLIVFDIPRSKGNDVTFPGIEKIKDGCFFTSKYESGMALCNPPHIFIFANSPPERGLLSLDRWSIKCLDDEADLLDI